MLASETLFQMKRRRKFDLIIFDASNLSYRAKHTVGDMFYRGRRTGVVFGSLKIIRKTIEDFHPERAVVVWDGGASYTRRLIFNDYKLARRNKKEDATELDKLEYQAMIEQMNETQNILELLGVPQIRIPRTEADDVIAYVACKSTSTSLICSTDRDFLHLVNDKISVYSPIRDCVYTDTNFSKFANGHASPRRYMFYKILAGDHSDGIPGISGIGEKTAIKIIEAFQGDLWNILFANRDDGASDIQKKFLDKLEEKDKDFRSKLIRNWHLMDLKSFVDLHIPTQNRETIDNIIFRTDEPNVRAVQKMFVQLGFQSLLKEFTEWTSTFVNMQKTDG